MEALGLGRGAPGAWECSEERTGSGHSGQGLGSDEVGTGALVSQVTKGRKKADAQDTHPTLLFVVVYLLSRV